MQQTLHTSADLAFHYVEPIIARPRDGFDQSRRGWSMPASTNS